jgi:hypothetical protein
VGGSYENNDFRWAQRVAEKVPAKRAPEAVKRLIAHYQANRESEEAFADFVRRVGPKSLGPVVSDLRGVAAMSLDTLKLFQDWDRDELYELIRGEGECAAPVVPMPSQSG